MVTTRRFRVGDETYTMWGVTSVAINRKDTGGGALAAGGLFLVLFGLFTALAEDPSARGMALGLLFVGLLCLADWYYKHWRPGRAYHVTLTSASGEQVAYSSPDEGFVRELVARLNDAIAARD